jgi:integral membrane protein
MLSTPLARLRTIGIIEGASFLLLLFVAMPLKYVWDMPIYVRIVGSAHGLLWVLYLAALGEVWITLKWNMARVAQAFIASVLPFGPFVLDARLRDEQRREAVPAG